MTAVFLAQRNEPKKGLGITSLVACVRRLRNATIHLHEHILKEEASKKFTDGMNPTETLLLELCRVVAWRCCFLQATAFEDVVFVKPEQFNHICAHGMPCTAWRPLIVKMHSLKSRRHFHRKSAIALYMITLPCKNQVTGIHKSVLVRR